MIILLSDPQLSKAKCVLFICISSKHPGTRQSLNKSLGIKKVTSAGSRFQTQIFLIPGSLVFSLFLVGTSDRRSIFKYLEFWWQWELLKLHGRWRTEAEEYGQTRAPQGVSKGAEVRIDRGGKESGLGLGNVTLALFEWSRSGGPWTSVSVLPHFLSEEPENWQAMCTCSQWLSSC